MDSGRGGGGSVDSGRGGGGVWIVGKGGGECGSEIVEG